MVKGIYERVILNNGCKITRNSSGEGYLEAQLTVIEALCTVHKHVLTVYKSFENFIGKLVCYYEIGHTLLNLGNNPYFPGIVD